jgi:signal transduction histidine kinase
MSGVTSLASVTGASRPARRPGMWAAGGAIAAGRGLTLAAVSALPCAALAVLVYVIARWPVPSVACEAVPASAKGPGGPNCFFVTAADPWLPMRLAAIALIAFIFLLAIRWLPSVARQLASRWCGTPIAVPYRPRPAVAGDIPPARLGRWIYWIAADPATWRDAGWTFMNSCGGWILAGLPAVLLITGAVSVIVPLIGILTPLGSGILPVKLLWLAAGLVLTTIGLLLARPMLRGYGAIAAAMLGPTRHIQLSSQVQHLAQTRSDTIDAGSAEMRRIERDLHDGTQARLVAIGMTLDIAEQLLDANPDATRTLLAEARESSGKALAELRNLVRGIHPPVLADRGLAEALRALALDSPVRTRLHGDLAGRPPAPVESAAYFAVSELLANVSKHAGADQAWIDIRHEGRALRIGVSDNGSGGADAARGTGLRGIERRLAAFDGVVAVSSPPGGPTQVHMEIPCELLSPKIFSC